MQVRTNYHMKIKAGKKMKNAPNKTAHYLSHTHAHLHSFMLIYAHLPSTESCSRSLSLSLTHSLSFWTNHSVVIAFHYRPSFSFLSASLAIFFIVTIFLSLSHSNKHRRHRPTDSFNRVSFRLLLLIVSI